MLNADPKTSLKSILGVSPGILRSDVDVDPELIIVINFREAVKLRGMRVLATEAKDDSDTAEASAPKTVKLFLNKPHHSFSECAAEEPTETLTLTPAQLASGEELRLKFVKFQNVLSLTIFIESNQSGSNQTFLNQLQFVGLPKEGTNMKELKKIEHDH